MPVKNVITDFCYIVHANSKSENTFSLADILFVHAQAAVRHHLTDLQSQLSVTEGQLFTFVVRLKEFVVNYPHVVALRSIWYCL